jgi:hypothetical protein
VGNLNDAPIEDETHSALSKLLCLFLGTLDGAEKAIRMLTDQAAEKIRKESVRILKMSKKPKSNIRKSESGLFKSYRAMLISP